jgi:small-conductance mechanosensitive channel
MDMSWLVLIVIVPVLLGVGSDMFRRWLTLKERQLEHAAVLAADRATAQAAHIDKLEQRVRVLERIATDGGSKLAAEIDELRLGHVN